MLRDYVWFRFETVLKVIARKPLEGIQVRFHNFIEKSVTIKLSAKFEKMTAKNVPRSGFRIFSYRAWGFLKISGFCRIYGYFRYQVNIEIFQKFLKISGFYGNFRRFPEFSGIFENLGIFREFMKISRFSGNF